MKLSLPSNHGLPNSLLTHPEVVFRNKEGVPSLTDVQWQALEAGIARGEGTLVIAPTSTGKTQIAIWALVSWLYEHIGYRRGIYLVTHRSLANQKFDELRHILGNNLFADAHDTIVLATGDRQINGNGAPVSNPLDATLLVATYEKYLGILSGAGIPTDLADTCIIADEIQILGDRYRGVNIETLLTLIHRANPGQFVGLSAVLGKEDGRRLAGWLGVQLVRVSHREKHLVYECRTPTRRLVSHTQTPDTSVRSEPTRLGLPYDLQSIVHECMDTDKGKPIVVFCMSKKDVYKQCKEYCRSRGVRIEGMPLLEGLSTDTPEAELLSATMPAGIAIHCADLVEEDRMRVEEAIKNREVDLVFATSTLAAGVNFPLGTVIFSSWKRWNQQRRHYEPISAAEFQNMAGRCGRMGTEHESGNILLMSDDKSSNRAVVNGFLDPDHLTPLRSQISPEHFSHMVLRLVASNVVHTENDALNFLKSSFGASRELESNLSGLNHWDEPFLDAISHLRDWMFLR